MLRWCYLVLIVAIIIASGMVMTRLIGSTHASPLTKIFTFANGSPCKHLCLLGIQPHVTTEKGAIALLEAHPLTQHLAVLNTKPIFVGNFQAGPLIMLHQSPDEL